ncbi:MAG: class I SAM-dependent methyltransferase [Actinomycetota bacterium]|nr:class I SAM-dependent methyltransferase [Actinomycetota bacterium]
MPRPERDQKDAAYAFGDAELAARRLELVSEVFAPTSRAFLAEVDFRPRLALDLGSGPGHTRHLIADTLEPEKTVGIETSAVFLSAARASTQGSGVSFVEHDATRMPLPLRDPDLVYARFLLSHPPRPAASVADWVTQPRPGGLLLLEEVEWIRTEHPVLGACLEIVEAMLADRGHALYVGPRLNAIGEEDGRRRRSSRVDRPRPSAGQAARMFSMSLANWRAEPFVRSTYSSETMERVEAGLSELSTSQGEEEILWGLRQIVIERT